LQVRDHNFRPFSSHAERDGPADPLRGAGDDRNFGWKSHGITTPPLT
jgi:hypothetical protein